MASRVTAGPFQRDHAEQHEVDGDEQAEQEAEDPGGDGVSAG